MSRASRSGSIATSIRMRSDTTDLLAGPLPGGLREGGPPPFEPIKDRLAALVPGVKRSK